MIINEKILNYVNSVLINNSMLINKLITIIRVDTFIKVNICVRGHWITLHYIR